MRILITGSSGFIGTAVVDRLVAGGHDVLGVDRKDPKPDTAGHEFVKTDILDASRIDRCFADFRPEGLIHLAAHMSLREDGSNERYKANTVGTTNLMDAAKRCAEMRRAIFTSSMAPASMHSSATKFTRCYRRSDEGHRSAEHQLHS